MQIIGLNQILFFVNDYFERIKFYDSEIKLERKLSSFICCVIVPGPEMGMQNILSDLRLHNHNKVWTNKAIKVFTNYNRLRIDVELNKLSNNFASAIPIEKL